MIEWLDQFYNDPDLRASMTREYLPLFSEYIDQATPGTSQPEFVESLVESYVDRYLGSSRAQLQEVIKGSADPLTDLAARFDEWQEKRPEKVSKNELVRSANAAHVEQLRMKGVTKKKWVTVGSDTCPFCKSLNGTVISVDTNFFDKGDSLNPEGAEAPMHFESSLGHPPIHQGCNCTVESAFNEEQVGKFSELTEAQLKAGLKDPRLQGELSPRLAKVKEELEEALRRKGFVPTPFRRGGLPGLTSEQYEAMRPLSRWDEKYRLAMRQSLRESDNGASLFDTLDKFQDGGSIARLRSKIESYLSGEVLDATSQARAESFIGALRNSPDWAPKTLYRGTNSKSSLKALLERYEPGKTIDFNITSFSSDRSVAKRFQYMNEGPRTTQVMIELVGPNKRTIPIQNLARDSRLFREKEWVTGGRYRILETKKAPGGGLLVRIQQEAPLGG